MFTNLAIFAEKVNLYNCNCICTYVYNVLGIPMSELEGSHGYWWPVWQLKCWLRSSLVGTFCRSRFQVTYCVDGLSSLSAYSVGPSGISPSLSRIGHFWDLIIGNCSESMMWKKTKKINELSYNVNFIFLLKNCICSKYILRITKFQLSGFCANSRKFLRIEIYKSNWIAK